MSTTARDRVLSALQNAGCKVSNGGRAATCPAHDDHNPSLSIGDRQDGNGVVVNCQTGCTPAAVVAALGLSMADLFDKPRDSADRPQLVATYPYVDEQATVLFEKLRYVPKTFRQKAADGSWTLQGVRRVLYRLPDVLAAIQDGRTVYVAEGEKDADTLARAGVTATAWTEGAWKAGQSSKWRPEYTQQLAGAHVVIIADRDEPGRHTAATIAAELEHTAATVRVVQAATGKDATDHLTAGHTIDDLEPVNETSTAPATESDSTEDEPLRTLDVIRADQVTIRRVVYLWEHRMPLGAMTLMPGEEGIGKTTVGIRTMADITRGTLPGEFYGTPRDVIVLATEDGLEDVFVPRLHEAGADRTRVHFVRATIGLDGDPRDVIVPRDLPLLSALVQEHDVALIWIDSLATTLPDDLKSIAYKDTAKVLRKLGHWAEQQRVAVAAPWHLNKAAGSDTAVRIMDSRAFRTAVRSMLLIVADPDAPEGETAGIVALDKANAGTLAVPGLRYRIRSAHYVVEEVDELTGEIHEQPASCGVADWTGEVQGDGRQIARDALAPKLEKEGGPREWLRDYLTDEGESQRSDVVKAAKEDGYSIDAIKRAARALGIHSREETGRDPKTNRPFRRALWSLPAKSGATHTTAPTAPTGEGYQRPTTPIYAGQDKSVQSVQSGVYSPTAQQTAPLLEQAAPLDHADTNCHHCGTDLSSAGPRRHTPGFRCYRCEHLADGTERKDPA